MQDCNQCLWRQMPTSLPMRHRPAVAHLVLARDPWKITAKAKSWRFGSWFRWIFLVKNRVNISGVPSRYIFQGVRKKKTMKRHIAVYILPGSCLQKLLLVLKFFFGRIGPPGKKHPHIPRAFWLGIAQILETKSLDMHHAVIRPAECIEDGFIEVMWRISVARPPETLQNRNEKVLQPPGKHITPTSTPALLSPWFSELPEVGYVIVPWKVLPCCKCRGLTESLCHRFFFFRKRIFPTSSLALVTSWLPHIHYPQNKDQKQIKSHADDTWSHKIHPLPDDYMIPILRNMMIQQYHETLKYPILMVKHLEKTFFFLR